MVEVIPAILEKEFSEIEKKVRLVEGLVNWVQIDIADNTLVPNTTFLNTGAFFNLIHHSESVEVGRDFFPHLPNLAKQTRFVQSDKPGLKKDRLNFELHMMVADPLRYLENFYKAGFKRFFAHIEGGYVNEYIEKCYQLGVEVGLAIDGPTGIERIRKYLDNIDAVLVMAIEAGESGRPFREDTISKIKKIREIDMEIPIAVDGAMNAENAAKVIAAGATRINSNSFIFNASDVKIAIETLKAI